MDNRSAPEVQKPTILKKHNLPLCTIEVIYLKKPVTLYRLSDGKFTGFFIFF